MFEAAKRLAQKDFQKRFVAESPCIIQSNLRPGNGNMEINPSTRRILPVLAWVAMLILSDLPDLLIILGVAPSSRTLLLALPLVPAAVLFAAVNAFTEEAYFRASILSTLHEVIGKTNTLLIAAVFFGLSHWLSGSPSGLLGFLMTGFLAWLMGRSMLETKGILWPWLIHFAPDVVIFLSYALLFVQS